MVKINGRQINREISYCQHYWGEKSRTFLLETEMFAQLILRDNYMREESCLLFIITVIVVIKPTSFFFNFS